MRSGMGANAWLLGVLCGWLGMAAQGALPPARDTSFQTLGMDGLPNAAAVLPDGKILVGGNFQTLGGVARPALARLNADGTLDTSFAPGLAPAGIWGKPVVSELVVQADGKIVVSGPPSLQTTGTVRTNVIRFNPDGTVDPSLDVREVVPFKGLAVQADGRIVLGIASPTLGFRPARLNADGSVDAGFGYAGGIMAGLMPLQFAAQPGGTTLVLAGDGDANRIGNQQLLRLNADGSNDAGFKFGWPPNLLVDDSPLVMRGDGSLFVTTQAGTPTVVKLAADGAQDPAVNWSGPANAQRVYPVAVAALPDGGVVAARQPTAGDRRLSFFYLSPTGALLATRDLPNVTSDNGVVGLGVLPARAFAMQPDGRLLFAEAFLDGTRNVFGMFRMPPPPVPAPPVITQQPQDLTIGAGDFLSLNVLATSESAMTYRWLHAGTNLTGQTTATLSLGSESRERAGEFQAVVSNANGSVTSRVATVTVRLPAPPVITVQPVGGTVLLSQSFSVALRLQTEVLTGYQWYKDGLPFRAGANQGNGILSLVLPGGDATRTGDYFAVITNAFGGSVTSDVARVELILPGPPRFTLEPADLDLFPGQPVQLRVATVGDGVPQYAWYREGTNLVVSADIPTVNRSNLTVLGRSPLAAGRYFVVATLAPGGSATSRVATVTVRPSGPPVLVSGPAPLDLELGASGQLAAIFNGEAPLTASWQREGTNVQSQVLSVVDGPLTNVLAVAGIPTSAGAYRFVVTNRNGVVASAAVAVTVRAGVPAEIRKDLADLVIPIGQFNTTNLSVGLVATNCCGQAETGHVLALTPTSGTPPFAATGPWHLGVGISNRFYVAGQSGVPTASGTWSYAPGTSGFTGLVLGNFPAAGNVSQLNVLGDGQYTLGLVGSATAAQTGTLVVLGSRRPATNSLAIEVYSSNAVQVVWYRDGRVLEPGSATARNFSLLTEAVGVVPPGGANHRYRLTVGDVTPAEEGSYWAVVSTLIRNPDPRGVPATFVGASSTSRVVRVTVRGYADGPAPGVGLASLFGTPTGLDDVTALAVAPGGTLLIGTRTVTFGGQTRGQSALQERDWAGALVASATMVSEQLNGTDLGVLRGVAPDGEGGAFVAGDGASGEVEPWFLRRVRPGLVVSGGVTNRTFTNLWTARSAGPFSNVTQNLSVPHGATVSGLWKTADGVVVAGQFTGRTRFGATYVPVNPALPLITVPVGGVTFTNTFEAVVGRHDGSTDAYVAKYDLSGRFQWARAFGGTNSEVVTGLSGDGAGNLYLSGSFKGRATFGTLTVESTKGGLPSNPSYAVDGFVAKLDATGQPLWVRAAGGLRELNFTETTATAVAPDGLGGAYFTANRVAGSVVLQPGVVVGTRYLGRLSPQGDLLWAQEFNSMGQARLVTDAAGNAVLADAVVAGGPGQSLTFGAATVSVGAFVGSWVGKVSPAGLLLWARGLDAKVPFADDPRPATVQALAVDASGGTWLGGRLPGGTSSTASQLAGQAFDGFELTTSGSSTTNSTDLFLARLEPAYVPGVPTFVQEPAPQMGLLQDRVVLEGRAGGNPVPSYQWYRDGVAVTGATNRLLIFNELGRADGGSYTLVASNLHGATTSPAVTLTPQLRPTMTGWTLAASATNYLGMPTRVAADDAGNFYFTHIETGNGAPNPMEAFRADGSFAWRFNEEVPGVPPVSRHVYQIEPRFAPLVTPSGAIFVAGRYSVDRVQGAGSTTRFLGRLNPVDGTFLWVHRALAAPGVALVAVDVDAAGNSRVATADRNVRRFDADGRELGATVVTALPFTADDRHSRVTFDRAGGYYFYGNRVEALALGPTNLPALGANPGAQNLVLARYDATGAHQWTRVFSGPGSGILPQIRLMVDGAGDALMAGTFGVGNQASFRFTFGTNLLGGFSYAAKVTAGGDVAWAKSWLFNVNDAALGADGSVVLGGWFRTVPAGAAGNRRIPFGTNLVGAALSHDTFVAVLGNDGTERAIRHTGSPDFRTFDNAKDYYVAVNARGSIWTAGYSLFPPASAGLHFGDVRYDWPDLRPYNIGNLFGDLATFYVARLDLEGAPPVTAEVTWLPPAPGSPTFRLSWPAGFRLQRRTSLYTGDWETLDVAPPYDADTRIGREGYFRVLRVP